ncbi:MAG: sigma 54-interacting transcriptional regulator [Planctomycetaceae bacterium]|nr:sigma 54-interacting transcriptional regulator [Planctomycetaceae bacterium]
MTAPLLISELYKGDYSLMVALRSQLEEIARTPGLVTVLIEGAPGTGKTTMARALAMARVLSMVDAQYHRLSVERAAREVREGAALKWYRDISLAGLTETLADGQLFGVGKGVATEVGARIGIFEQAMTGCLDPKTAKSHRELIADAGRGDGDLIPLVTGGIVLLDEIGDLAPTLQAKLLRVLNGEMQFRVGTEGNTDFGFVFRGLVALATWRDIDGECHIRDDLRQRITQHRVRVPGLSEYPSEVRLQIVLSVTEVVKREIRDELAHIDQLVAADGTDKNATVLSPEWLQQVNRSAETKLPKPLAMKLAAIDWSACGQLRGLRATLRRVLCGTDLDAALAESQAAFARSRKAIQGESNAERFKRYLANGHSLSDAWFSDRHQWATELLGRLDLDDPDLLRIVADAGRTASEIKKELRNLMRSGSKSSGT